MSLENTVASYQIQITRTGEGAAEAANEFNKVTTAANAAAAAGKHLAEAGNVSRESLKQVREVSLLTRESFHGLNEIAILAGGSLSKELMEGVMVARMGLMTVRTAAQLTGVSLSVIAPIVGAVALAAGAGFLAWSQYRDELKKNEDQTKSFGKALADVPTLLANISKASKAGLINPGDAARWTGALSKATSSTQWSDEQNAVIEAAAKANGLTNFSLGNVVRNPISGDPAKAIAQVKQESEALTTEQIKALEELSALQSKFQIESLSGFQRERAEAKKTYDEHVAQINSLAALSGKQAPGAIDAAAGSYLTKMREITEKENQELVEASKKAEAEILAAKKAEQEEIRQLVSEDNAATLEQIKQFEDDLTIKSLQSKGDRIQIAQQEYDARIAYYEDLYAFGQLTEDQLTDYEAQATKKRLQAQQQAEKLHVMSMVEMQANAAQSFSSGFAQAFVDFASGAKSAQQAFEEFAAAFLKQIAEMILQQLILNAIKSMLFSGGGTATAASGGFFPTMAAGGLDGVSSVSSPTYFPKFNVIAGEAGREMLTVLARPRFMNLGGIEAVVGQAGRNTLAITNAHQLAQSGAGASGGRIQIEISHSDQAEARIINSSIQGAEVRIIQRAQQNSPVRDAIKRANA